MVNGMLYTAYSDGSLTRRTFDGTTYGPAVPVNGADLLVPQTDWHNSDVPTITSLFYDRGKIYFTRSGQNVLYNRAFEPESGVVGQQRFSTNAVAGVSYSNMRGAFVAGNRLYFADAARARCRAVDWNGSGPCRHRDRADECRQRLVVEGDVHLPGRCRSSPRCRRPHRSPSPAPC